MTIALSQLSWSFAVRFAESANRNLSKCDAGRYQAPAVIMTGGLIDRFLPAQFHADAARSFQRPPGMFSAIGPTLTFPENSQACDSSRTFQLVGSSSTAACNGARSLKAQSFAVGPPICAYSVKEKEPLPDVLKRAGKRCTSTSLVIRLWNVAQLEHCLYEGHAGHLRILFGPIACGISAIAYRSR